MTDCTGCTSHPCYQGYPCVRGQDLTAYTEPSRKQYTDPLHYRIAEVAARIEGEHYLQWTRLEEIMQFSREMHYKRIGLAHCVGLTQEALALKKILSSEFLVDAICCKFSGIDKKELQLTQIDCQRYEAICNPIGQAFLLNDLSTDLNLIIGLCIGHDILFTKYSQAPVTTFIVKDRVTGHNPAIVLYNDYLRKRFTSKG